MSDVIAKALERLDDSCVGELKLWNPAQAPITGFVKPLADLIRQTQNSTGLHRYCALCSGTVDRHMDDCALIALCAAILGEKP